MALKKCLYCDKEISEFTNQCPKCKADHPHDADRKYERETREENERKTEAVLNSFTECAECGTPIKIGAILREYNGKTCLNCGFSGNFIKCYACGKSADDYDPVEEKYTCKKHPKCYGCGKRFREEELIKRSFGKYHFAHYCKSCAGSFEYHFKKLFC